MRVLALDADLIVFISRVWQTTCTAVRAGEEGFLIDSPVYPDELEALPQVLAQARFPLSGLLATHADWDHLLGRLAFSQAPLGSGQSTADRLGREPGRPQRELRRFDEEHYIERAAPLTLPPAQAIPVPGRLSLGAEHELELHPCAGHTEDGTAYLMPWLGVLACGDYLSPVEIPMISEGGSLEAYAQTVERLRGLLERAETVVPGHGAPLDRDRALRVLDEDATYLEALRSGGSTVQLPPDRNTPVQRRIHQQNVERVAATACRS